MTSIPKYTHQDVVNFLKDGVAPEDLTCSIGLDLMRRPVRMDGDTVDRPYEAKTARKALELKHQNPFTRAPITAHPALHPDPVRQRHVRQFRAMVLAYTKVAAYLEETGDTARLGTPLVTAPAGLSLRHIAAGQTLRNALLGRLTERPLEQPLLPQYFYHRAEEARERAELAESRARRAVLQADQAADVAHLVAHQTRQVARPPVFQLDSAWEDAKRDVEARGMDAVAFATRFDKGAVEAAAEVLANPTPTVLRDFVNQVRGRAHEPSDVFLFQDGALLRALLEDRAYHGLASLHDTLAAQTQSIWHVGPTPNGRHWYIGGTQGGQPQGAGVMVTAGGALYSAGNFLNGSLHGHGLRRSPAGYAAGLWHQGVFRQGVLKNPVKTAAGTFANTNLHGFCRVESATETSQGWFEHGRLVRGQTHQGSGSHWTLFTESNEPGEESVGSVAHHDGGQMEMYYGAMARNMPNGIGVLRDAAGVEMAARWHNGDPVGPGSILYSNRIQFGTWGLERGDWGEALATFALDEELPLED